MIIATAGHVDHGKTALVRALTGVDTDRLPEEKARGMTIDLGFAYTAGPDGEMVGFVDVPGHERFVANMLAGVAGIDAALLVVAADDGPMPQTVEHLAILDLLGVTRGAVAISKIDRVDPDRVLEVEASLRAMLGPSSLATAPLVPVSVVTGTGVDRLRSALFDAPLAGRSRGDRFRLAVDRAFLLPGIGLVATGTVLSGAVVAGDQLVVAPAGRPVRVRSLRAQSRPAERAATGMRIALNLAGEGATVGTVGRGDWLLEPGALRPTRRLDVLLRPALGGVKPLAREFPVHVHIGAADVTGRAVLLDAPGRGSNRERWAQLVLDRDVVAVHGDRFIVRDRSARRTVAGGRVIAPAGAVRGRARPERLAVLNALAEPDPATALRRLLAETVGAVDLGAFQADRNLSDAAAAALWRTTPMHRAEGRGGPVGVNDVAWRRWTEGVLQHLAAAHAAEPDRAGLDAPSLRRSLDPAPPPDLLEALLRSLIDARALVYRMGAYRLPGHVPRLAEDDMPLWLEIEQTLADPAAGMPVVHVLAAAIGREPEAVRRILLRAARVGLAVQASRNRFLLPAQVVRLANAAEAAGRAFGGAVDLASFRELAAIGRNIAIEVLELFDRSGLTRRAGGERRLVRRVETVFGTSDP